MFKNTNNILYLLDLKKKELPEKVKIAAFDFDHTLVRLKMEKFIQKI